MNGKIMYTSLIGGAALLLCIAFVASIKMAVKPLYIIYVGGGITLVGGLATLYGTFKQNKSSSVNTQKIILTTNQSLEIVHSIDTLSKINNEIGAQIDIIVKKNKELSEENLKLSTSATELIDSIRNATSDLTTLSNRIKDEITGSNSVPIVTVISSSDGVSATASFSIYKIGVYPIRNIRIKYSKESLPIKELYDKNLINIEQYLRLTAQKEIKEIPFLDGETITNLFEAKLSSYFNESSKALFSVDVSWRDKRYFLIIGFVKSMEKVYKIESQTYIYEGKWYNSTEEFERAIRATFK